MSLFDSALNWIEIHPSINHTTQAVNLSSLWSFAANSLLNFSFSPFYSRRAHRNKSVRSKFHWNRFEFRLLPMNLLNRVNLSVVLYSILLLALIAELDSLCCFCSVLWWGVFVCSTISTTTTPRLIKIIFQYVLSSSRFSRFVIIIASRLVSFYQFLLDSDVRASDCFRVTIGKELAEFIATFTATILASSCRSLSGRRARRWKAVEGVKVCSLKASFTSTGAASPESCYGVPSGSSKDA